MDAESLSIVRGFCHRREADMERSYAEWHDRIWSASFVTEYDWWAPMVGADEARRFGYSRTRTRAEAAKPYELQFRTFGAPEEL